MKIFSEEIRTIAIFRALQLGDLLCSIPAFRALRKAYPHAQISVIGLPWMNMLPERFPAYFDEFIIFPGYPGLPEQPWNPADTISFMEKMINRRFDLVLQMQGNGSVVNPMVELFGAKHTAGFFKNDYCPDADLFLRYPEGISEIDRHLALMEFLCIPTDGKQLEFTLTEKDYEDFGKIPGLTKLENYLCVHPGSRGSWRQWPAENFALLADHCHNMGYEIVITGTGDELPVVERVVSRMKHQPFIAAGKTSLGSVGVLIKKARGLISNCTGVSHIASAFKTRSVVISMDGEPERWSPLDKELHYTIDWTKTPDFNLALAATNRLFG